MSVNFKGSYPSRPYDKTLSLFAQALEENVSRIAVIEGTADRLRFLVARHLQITVDDAAWLKLLDREAHSGEAYFGSTLHQLNRRYAQFLTRTLADGIARGELRAGLDPQMARDFLFGGVEHWVRNTVGRINTIKLVFFRARFSLRNRLPRPGISPSNGTLSSPCE